MRSNADLKKALNMLESEFDNLSTEDIVFVLDVYADIDPVGFIINLENVAQAQGYRDIAEMRDYFRRKTEAAIKLN
jgi:hypothetical protein